MGSFFRGGWLTLFLFPAITCLKICSSPNHYDEGRICASSLFCSLWPTLIGVLFQLGAFCCRNVSTQSDQEHNSIIMHFQAFCIIKSNNFGMMPSFYQSIGCIRCVLVKIMWLCMQCFNFSFSTLCWNESQTRLSVFVPFALSFLIQVCGFFWPEPF